MWVFCMHRERFGQRVDYGIDERTAARVPLGTGRHDGRVGKVAALFLFWAERSLFGCFLYAFSACVRGVFLYCIWDVGDQTRKSDGKEESRKVREENMLNASSLLYVYCGSWLIS